MSDYKILKVIGKGAFGDAYLGLHLKQKKEYVIKQVDIKNKSKEEKEHIFHEVKLLQQFNHVNIVEYKDSFIDKKGLLNIVMQYCEGGDMNQLVESLEGNKIPEDKVVYWLAQIALAILYLHQRKILHRDLKSPNIFILKGNIRLGDFGISKVLDHVRDLAQTNIGTPYYMSPEQYNHKPYSYKSDIWAFGCILYEMCNQRRPFQANNIQALGMKVVRGNFPPVSQCYSKQLRHLISEMLAKNPVKRPNIIEILQKPFIKKKLVDYMRSIYEKKIQLSKESLETFLDQAKKLGVNLDQKKTKTPAAKGCKDKNAEEKQRSVSARKQKLEEEKQKEKLQRQNRKRQLQDQLNRQNRQRKEMAEKLKKIEEERRNMLGHRKSEKNLKQIYKKVVQKQQKAEQEKQEAKTVQKTVGKLKAQKKSQQNAKEDRNKEEDKYKSQKYAQNSRKTGNSRRQSISGKISSQKQKTTADQKGNQNESTAQSKKQQVKDKAIKVPESGKQKIESNVKEDTKGEDRPFTKSQARKSQKKEINQSGVDIQEDKKAFRMQEEYQMQFEDCQPGEEEDYAQSSDFQFNQDTKQQKNQQKEANKQHKLVLEGDIQEIQNLVKESNKAVKQLQKNEKAQKQQIKEQNETRQIRNQEAREVSPTQQKKGTKEHKIQTREKDEKWEQNVKQIKKNEEKILEKVESLKQEIKMKTQHINSIRNELSNIDFELTDSEQEQEFGKIKIYAHKPQQVQKKQFNPLHAKINDRINTLKESAMTILGSEKYTVFYELLSTYGEKGRQVSRSYLETVLGKEKVGVYHLVEQILRLSKVLEKIPKWLY